jgi:hypothetical protein
MSPNPFTVARSLPGKPSSSLHVCWHNQGFRRCCYRGLKVFGPFHPAAVLKDQPGGTKLRCQVLHFRAGLAAGQNEGNTTRLQRIKAGPGSVKRVGFMIQKGAVEVGKDNRQKPLW